MSLFFVGREFSVSLLLGDACIMSVMHDLLNEYTCIYRYSSLYIVHGSSRVLWLHRCFPTLG